MLLEHNAATLNELRYFTDRGENCCVVNPCGSGKTSVMSAFIRDNPSKSFTVFTKQRNAASYYHSKDAVFHRENVHIATYNKMHCDVKADNVKAYDTDYFVLDEAHYIGANRWSKSLLHLISLYDPTLIGLTATPQRFEDQGTNTTIVNTFFSNHSAGNFTTQDLEKKGVFVEPTYVPSVYDLPETINKKIDQIIESSLDDDTKQQLYQRLNETLNNWMRNARPSDLMRKHLPDYMYKPACNRILVYISSVKNIEDRRKFIDATLYDIFPDKTIKSYIYTYQTAETQLQDFLAEDNDTYIKVLYSIDKIMETVHINDLRILIMMRPSVSNRIITQQFGRVNSIGNQQKPIIFDMVDNLGALHKKIKPPTPQVTENPSQPKTKQNIEIPILDFYNNLFQSIDNVLKHTQHYTYHGFTGTLRDICYVFDADYNAAKSMIQTHDIEDIIDQLSCSETRAIRPYTKQTNTEDVCVLSPNQKVYAEQNMYIVENFIRNNHIENEDIQQNLYVKYLQAVYASDSYTFRYPAGRKFLIQNRLHKEYLKQYRQTVRTEYHTNALATAITEQLAYPQDQDVPQSHIRDMIDKAMSNLTPREKACISWKFGLTDGREHTYDEIAREYNVTRERIRQIIAKGLRKLRHPSRVKYIRSLLDVFDQ